MVSLAPAPPVAAGHRPRTARTPRRPWSTLASKLLGTTFFILLLVGGLLTFRASSQLEAELHHAFRVRGEAIALSLAAASEGSHAESSTSIQGSIDSNKVLADVAYIYIVSAEGKVTVHTFHPSFPEGLDRMNAVSLQEVLGWTNQRVKVARLRLARGLDAIDVAAPIAGGALGTVHVGLDAEAIARRVVALRWSLLGSGGIATAAGMGLIFIVFFFAVLRPVRRLTGVTSEIVRSGDLTQPIGVRSADEIGELADSFRDMVRRLREIPVSLRESTGLLGRVVVDLTTSTRDQTAMINRQAAALQEAQATVQEIKQTSLVAAQRAAGVLEVADRADTIGKTGEQAIEVSLAALQEIRSQVVEIAGQISQLNERTRQIGLITETVKDLADQSNMLALNAAIEAVRSGEHGKGFAVVAREIRSLADQSIQATKRVRDILDDVRAATRTAVAITEAGASRMEGGLVQVRVSGEKLRELSSIVRDNAAAVRQIAAAVNQQNAGVGQIVSAVSELNSLMDDTVNRLEATSTFVTSLHDVSAQVTGVVERFRVE